MKQFHYNGKSLDLTRPVVMGILNITPDSFYDGGSYPTLNEQVEQAGRMLEEGAAVIDLGGASTRPGSGEVDEEEELLRVMPALQAILRTFSGCLLSVDTYRASIARHALDNGAFMVNDVTGGTADAGMLSLMASRGAPYVMMHMKGTPKTMQTDPRYGDVTGEISYFFEAQLKRLEEQGYYNTILDPGFGFGKTVAHNFEILRRLDEFAVHGYPLLVGLSRKSMINRVLGTTPAEALNGTSVLNAIALLKGVSILRVHDVREAVETIRLVERTTNPEMV